MLTRPILHFFAVLFLAPAFFGAAAFFAGLPFLVDAFLALDTALGAAAFFTFGAFGLAVLATFGALSFFTDAFFGACLPVKSNKRRRD